VIEVKAIACELPATRAVPLGRWSLAELRDEVITTGLIDQVSVSTIWRWLNEDALKPWRHRSWIFPRDPAFAAKAGVVLDLYARRFQGRRLEPGEFVISADEKTSIQARCRCHLTLPPAVARVMRVEHEYERGGRWPTWRPGTSIRPACSAAASRRPGSSPSEGWWSR
jgi:hypothetical protein